MFWGPQSIYDQSEQSRVLLVCVCEYVFMYICMHACFFLDMFTCACLPAGLIGCVYVRMYVYLDKCISEKT